LSFFLASQAAGKTVFVSAGGTGNGRSAATAMDFARLKKSNLAHGDSVLLKRGEVFYGELAVSAGVYFGGYGTGASPVITGLKQVIGWRRHAGNIFVASFNAPAPVSLVLLNGVPVGMGRFPNSGYFPYTGHAGKTSLTGAAIQDLPFTATGAEAVVRKERWILDRHSISAHNGAVLQFVDGSPDGGNNGREGVDKNGFFLQNHLQTLDKESEWWYDKTSKRLFMVLADADQLVQVSAVSKLVDIGQKNDISFAGLDFIGSAVHAISMDGSKNISFTGCRFLYHGQTGIYGIRTTRLTVTNSVIRHCLNNGIWIEWEGKNTRLVNVMVADCGTIAGAGRSGDAAQQGISVSGDGTVIRRCTVLRTGYNSIHFSGSRVTVEENRIDSFCLVKDDGAGIYNFEGEGQKVRDRTIRNNTILHAVGAFEGAERYDYEAYGKAASIYLDGDSHETEVSGNVIGYGPWVGFFVNNNGNHRFTNNLVYGHDMAILLSQSKAGRIRQMVIAGNQLVGQKPLYFKLYEADKPEKFGRFSKNSYSKGEGVWIEQQFKGGRTEKLDFGAWKALGMDKDAEIKDHRILRGKI
jgi:hypothetical protein